MKESNNNTIMFVLVSVLFLSSFMLWQSYKETKAKANVVESEVATLPENSSVSNENSKKVSKKYSFVNSYAKEDNNIVIETNKVEAVFTNKGGNLVSLFTKEHKEVIKDENNVEKKIPINMIFSENGETAFNLKFGNFKDYDIEENFKVKRISDKEVEFYTYFYDNSNNKIKLSKNYKFVDDEYLFQLTVKYENSVNSDISIGDKNNLYTLSFVPQIGPEFKKLKKRDNYVFRNFIYQKGKDYKTYKKSGYKELYDINYVGIDNRYFVGLAVPPQLDINRVVLNKGNNREGFVKSNIFFERKQIKAKDIEDVYKFYLGPKTKKQLGKYATTNNNFKYENKALVSPAPGMGFLGLRAGIKNLMKLIHRIGVKNWGLVIIILTIIIKLLLFPLTFSSYKSTSKMQEFQPQLKEIQEKYKGNQQKIQMETSKIYKEEGVNPLKGCLPMLLQMPILFALFGVLRTMFELRGMPFFGWITDLSSPETVFTWAKSIPIISGFSQNNIRILPALFVATQIISSKIMQQPGTNSQANMKMMTYLMPVMFFFMLYNMPSGLFVYWITSNVITTIQQLSIKKVMHNRKVSGKQAEIDAKKAAKKKAKKPGKISSFMGSVMEKAQEAQDRANQQQVKSKKKK